MTYCNLRDPQNTMSIWYDEAWGGVFRELGLWGNMYRTADGTGPVGYSSSFSRLYGPVPLFGFVVT